jgi:hypothetical protein
VNYKHEIWTINKNDSDIFELFVGVRRAQCAQTLHLQIDSEMEVTDTVSIAKGYSSAR